MTDTMLACILRTLPLYSYRFANEVELHSGIAAALDAAAVPYVRELQQTKKDRFDFFCGGGVVIEAKVAGTLPKALDQVDRYCQIPEVTAVVVASSRQWAKSQQAMLLHSKPMHIIHLRSQAF